MSIDQRIVDATEQLEKDVKLTYDIVNGDDNTEVMTEGGPVPTHAKVAKDSNLEIIGLLQPAVDSINQHAELIISEANRSENAAEASSNAKDASERARDAAAAIAYEGEATLEPGAGKLAIADQEAKFSHLWLRPIGVPAPDFELPLRDSMAITHGKGMPYQIDVSAAQDGSVMVDLPMFRAGFERNSIKYAIHYGKLFEYGINDASFDRYGIFLEGESRNFLPRSNPGSAHDQSRYDSTVYDQGDIPDATEFTERGENGEYRIEMKSEYNNSQGSWITGSIFVKFNDSYLNSDRVPNLWIRSHGEHHTEGKVLSVSVRFNKKDNGFEPEISSDESNSIWRNSAADVVGLDNGWYRFSVSGELLGSTNDLRLRFYTINPGTSYQGDSQSGFILALAQLEPLPFASSPVRTDGSVVIRPADQSVTPCSLTGDYTLSYLHQCADSNGPYTSIWGKNTGSFRMHVDGSDPTRGAFVYARTADGFSVQAIPTGSYEPGKIARTTHTVGNGRVRTYVNGIKVADDEIVGDTDNHDGIILTAYSGTSKHIKDFRIWHHVLTEQQIYNL